jgi:hypothetical protein
VGAGLSNIEDSTFHKLLLFVELLHSLFFDNRFLLLAATILASVKRAKSVAWWEGKDHKAPCGFVIPSLALFESEPADEAPLARAESAFHQPQAVCREEKRLSLVVEGLRVLGGQSTLLYTKRP